MEKVRLGKNGPMVSRIGLGCMGMTWGYCDLNSEQRSSAQKETDNLHVISEALDQLGITFLDTADAYAGNEQFLAKALALRHRSSYVLASKCGFSLRDGKLVLCGAPDYMLKCCDASLARLGLNYIDLYYLHRKDAHVPIEESMKAMATLVKQGKILNIGLSEVCAATLRAACAVHPVCAVQSEYSIWWRKPEEELLPACRELGVGFVPFGPLGSGILTGNIKDVKDIHSMDYRFDHLPRLRGGNAATNFQFVNALSTLSQAKGCTNAQLALSWVMAHGEDIVPIPGTTRLERLRENAASVNVKLSKSDMAAVDGILAKYPIAGERYDPEAEAMAYL